MKALLAHPGTQYSAQLARQLYRLDCLHRFWTSFALAEGSLLDRKLRRWMRTPPKWLGNRVIAGIPAEKLRTVPHLEFSALLRLRLGQEMQVVMHDRNEVFQRAIPQKEIAESDVVIGFDTSSNILVERAATARRPLLLDQTIAHPRAKAEAYKMLAKQFPEWLTDLEVRRSDVSAAENSEHQKAHRVVVASTFTRRTLVENGVPFEKIRVNPYGVDLTRFSMPVRRSTRNGALRFLFAGLISARKGIPLLLKAWNVLDTTEAELTIVGPVSPTAPKQWLGDSRKANFLGKVSNAELARIMADSDVFLFPSYFEGFALVLLEAMACGLPVITTTATAGPDILSEGENGWVIDPGDLESLTSKMRYCIEHRDNIRQMAANARQTAERFSWDAYGDRWLDILNE